MSEKQSELSHDHLTKICREQNEALEQLLDAVMRTDAALEFIYQKPANGVRESITQKAIDVAAKAKEFI